jgi:hypothetical protein
LLAVAALAGATLLSSCDGEDPEVIKLEVPSTYAFTRENKSTVSYTGQTSRMDQLAEMKVWLLKGDKGEAVSAQSLKDMFVNKDGNGGGSFTKSYEKQLKEKTYSFDQAYFEGLMDQFAAASAEGAKGTQAEEGKAGLIKRSSGSTVLVDANGKELTQLIEKGLMGATFYYQICEVYLTESKIGNAINNSTVVDGQHYTDMEHHWDEAFGYLGVPVDYPANITGIRYWGKYTNDRTARIGSGTKLMEAFLKGRTAIVNKDYTLRDQQRDIIYEELEKVAAATAIHYINQSLATSNQGDRLHAISEAYTFVKGLKYSSKRKLTLDQINTIADTNIGTNFWQATETGLKAARTALANAYGLSSVQESL